MNTYYLYTEPYTIYSYKNKWILLYNSLDGKSTIAKVEKELEYIAEGLEKEKCMMLTKHDIEKEAVQNFIQLLRNSFNGDILPAEEKRTSPALFHPIINNQRAFERLQKVDKINIDNQVMNYLEEVYIYLNGVDEESNFPVFRQVPSYMNQVGNINSDQLLQWMNSIHEKQINQLHLLGGDVMQHPDFKEIISTAKSKAHEVILHYRYDLFKKTYLKQVGDEDIKQLFLIVPMQIVKEALLGEKVEELEDYSFKQWVFLISSEYDYMQAEKLIAEYKVENYQFKPLFTGNNLNFFIDDVFLYKEDILSLSPSKREIYANQTINRNEFGRITVLPNGNIYANLNRQILGSIEKDRIHDIIYHEMNEGSSWLNIRNQSPCSDCIFQWICPPPSNYELVMNKPNLCNVKLE